MRDINDLSVKGDDYKSFDTGSTPGKFDYRTESGKIANIGIWAHYYESNTFDLSEIAATEIFELDSTSGISADKVLDVFYKEDKDKILKSVASMTANKEAHEYRLLINGKLKYVNITVQKVYTDDRGVVAEGFIQDVTKLTEDFHKFDWVSKAVNKLDLEIYVIDLYGNIKYCNDLVHDRYNIDASQPNFHVTTVNPSLRGELFSDMVDNLERNNHKHTFKTEHQLPDGKKMPVVVSASMDFDYDGKPTIWAYVRDISDEIKQSRKLKELNNIIQTILDSAPIYMFVKDGVDFRYMLWNKSLERYSGIPASKAIGKDDFELYSAEEAQMFRNVDVDLLKSNRVQDVIESYVAPSGDTHVLKMVKVVIREDNSPPLIVGIALDITDMKKYESEIIDARSAAEESSKLKTALLANMSNKLQTTLNSIVGFAKILSDSDEISERRQYYSIMEKDMAQLMKSINDVVDISKIESGNIAITSSPVDIQAMFKRVFELNVDKVNSETKLVLDDKAGILTLKADEEHLFYVISNLVSNSIRFTERGAVRFGYRYENGILKIDINDTGQGLVQDSLSKVMQQFDRQNYYAQECGLSFVISKMIIEKMSGMINVESTDNVGNKFTVTVPCESVSLSGDSSKSLVTDPVRDLGAKKVILVAEDVDSNFQLLQALIGKMYDLKRAYNGREALNIFTQMDTPPDIILMDIKMPEMNGIEATLAIRKLSSTVPIVALTANAFNDDRVEAMNAGCNDFLSKPVSLSILKSTIARFV